MNPFPPLPEDDDDFLAAEYVLGALDLAERAGAYARLKADPTFAARVLAWEERLSDLNEGFAPAPLPDLLPRIEARLFPQPARRGWFLDLRLWGGMVAASVALVAYLALTPPAPDMTAALVAEQGTLEYAAVIAQGRLTITRVAGDASDAGKSLELWIIVGTDPPVSLGVIAAAGETISLPEAAPGAILAISLEPLGGSPTGQPTGPILVAGALVKV